ncbi:MAG: FAD:protein FMN transferase [Gammaproteobacteria bacterium]|nr:FAD:protein FMN transferase [Gammaproteobacteria bacterium]
MGDADYTLEFRADHWVGRFQAMASPCEVLMDVEQEAQARELTQIAHAEALRIEHKFSRYRQDNIVHRIHRAQGEAVEVDPETAALLDFAGQCYTLSEGLFDITSGVLRQVWRFDGSDRLPTTAAVKKILPRIGWEKIRWQRPRLCLPAGMEIDFGGIGKEYAVDKTLQLLRARTTASVLVNFGGDLVTSGPRRHGQGWIVGVENPTTVVDNPPLQSHCEFELNQGGVATSGDSKRFLLKRGVRYSHILNPRTGWPIPDAPRAVTVTAATCTDAGILATLAMLHGKQAEQFLQTQHTPYWCIR